MLIGNLYSTLTRTVIICLSKIARLIVKGYSNYTVNLPINIESSIIRMQMERIKNIKDKLRCTKNAKKNLQSEEL